MNHAGAIAADVGQLRALRDLVGAPHDLSWGQWLQLYALTLHTRPDLILDLGRGYGNSTAVFTQAATRLPESRVVSVGFDAERYWATQVSKRIERSVAASWFEPLTILQRNVVELELDALLGPVASVLVFWDVEGETAMDFLLAELLPRLVRLRHLVAVHDVSDARSEWSERAYVRADGSPTYWHDEYTSPVRDWSKLHDFLSRNQIPFEGARRAIDRLRGVDVARVAAADAALAQAGAEDALTDGHWIYFELPHETLHFPKFEAPDGPVGTTARNPYPTDGEHPVFAHFKRWEGWVDGGWDVNWLGVKTRTEYYNVFTVPEERRYVVVPPLPHDEEYFEWIDLLEAVVEARDHFVFVELGAGWGRWVSNAAAAINQYSAIPYTLFAVEAEPEHFRFLRRHLADNRIDLRSVRLEQAAVAAVDGAAVFEVGQSRDYYGQATLAIAERPSILRRLAGRAEALASDAGQARVRAVSLKTLLRRLDYVDLVDADIQGAEADVFEAAADVLREKVRRVHIETHNRDVEVRLRAFFAELGWKKLWDFPSESDTETPYGLIHFEGGVQTWLNPGR